MKVVRLMERVSRNREHVVASYIYDGDSIRIESTSEYGAAIAEEIGNEGIRSGKRRYYLKDGLSFLKSLRLEYNGSHFWATEVLDVDEAA